MFEVIRRRLDKELIVPVTLILLVFLWMLYPMRGLSWLLPGVQYIAAALLVTLTVLVVAYREQFSIMKPPPLIWWFLALYLTYFVSLGVASIASGDSFSMVQYIKYIVKILFFFLLLSIMSEELIRKSLGLYCHIVLGITLVSLATMFLVSFFYVQPLFSFEFMSAGGDVIMVPFYGFVYYGQAPIPTDEFPWARLQGLCGEPGTFALAISPAYFWFLIVEKSIWKLAVVSLGLVLTVSFGMFALLVLVVIAVLLFRSHSWKKLLVHIIAGLSIIMVLTLPTDEKVYEQAYHWSSWSSWVKYLENKQEGVQEGVQEGGAPKGTPEDFARMGKETSYSNRSSDIKDVLYYLSEHAIGTGASLGMTTLKKPVSVGYAVAALESGIVGGIAYMISFALLGFVVVRSIKRSRFLLEFGDLKQTLAFTVLTLLFFGAQRMQPDLSFWQMWFYSMFVWIVMRGSKDKLIS